MHIDGKMMHTDEVVKEGCRVVAVQLQVSEMGCRTFCKIVCMQQLGNDTICNLVA